MISWPTGRLEIYEEQTWHKVLATFDPISTERATQILNERKAEGKPYKHNMYTPYPISWGIE